jgi:hypothetical protein
VLSIPNLVRVRLAAAALVAALISVIGASSALADSSLSQNWAGYAARGTTFTGISARWRQPSPSCTRGEHRYSAMWVGLGGYSATSQALEQIGTEFDCTASGHVLSNAWYELVPANSNTLAMKVKPGDLMSAAVLDDGSYVTLTISNLTRHKTFRKTLLPSALDLSSAEWILEAPSACVEGTNDCRTLPLADFHHAKFTLARAVAAGGSVHTISSGNWDHTRITLGPAGEQFVSDRSGDTAVAVAKPSSLINDGSSFTITYEKRYIDYTDRNPFFEPLLGPTYIRHARLQ